VTDDRERYTLDLTPAEASELRALLDQPGLLRRKPRRRLREAPDVAATVNRLLTALGRRAGDDPEVLPVLRELATTLDDVTGQAVRQCHDAGGYSWGELAQRLGTSRQAVQQRYGSRREADEDDARSK
jgi:hypothetical protein